jgi:hypothetical protein
MLAELVSCQVEDRLVQRDQHQALAHREPQKVCVRDLAVP